MEKIAIIGAGGFGKEVQMLIEQINNNKPLYDFLGFFDDGVDVGTSVNGYPVLGNLSAINKIDYKLGIVSAIGEPRLKEKLLNLIKNDNIYYPTLIHPNVLTGNLNYVEIGEGTIITAGNIITTNIKIGKHVILNLACTIGHDSSIEDFCSLMPSVNISGEVELLKGVYIGTGVKIINQLRIGQFTTVGAGAVVAKTLPDHCTAVGIPAKIIKHHR